METYEPAGQLPVVHDRVRELQLDRSRLRIGCQRVEVREFNQHQARLPRAPLERRSLVPIRRIPNNELARPHHVRSPTTSRLEAASVNDADHVLPARSHAVLGRRSVHEKDPVVLRSTPRPHLVNLRTPRGTSAHDPSLPSSAAERSRELLVGRVSGRASSESRLPRLARRQRVPAGAALASVPPIVRSPPRGDVAETLDFNRT